MNIALKKVFELLIILALLTAFIFIGKNKLAAFYSNQGHDYYESALCEEAIDCFNKSLKLNPSVGIIRYNLAKAYDKARLTEKAISEYKKAIQLDSSFVLSYEALANIYCEQKLYQKAIAVLKEAEVNVKDSQEIKYLINHVSSEYMAHFMNIAMDAFSDGEKARAYELLNKALQINPDFAFTHYLFGYFYYVENKYDKAVDKLNEALQLDKMFFPAHKLLGDVYFEENFFNKAVNEYKAAVSINRQDAALLNNLGLAFMNLEDYQEAVKFLEEALNLDPENIHFRYSLASVYRDAGRLKKSAAEYSLIINRQPDYPNVHNDLADIYEQEGRKEEAVEEYQKELGFCLNKLLTNPDDPLLLNGIACAYNGIGEYDKAKMFVKKALAIKPDYREAYLTLANIQNNLCGFEDAMAALEQAKTLSSHRLYFIEKAINDVKQLKFFPTDIIYLKNKRRFEGIIKRKTENTIVLEVDIGSSIGTVTLLRDDIERIVSKD